MVEEGDVAGFGGAGEVAGGGAVDGARGEFAAGLAVGEDQAGTADPDGVGEDGTGGKDVSARAIGVGAEMKAVRVLIQMRHPTVSARAEGSMLPAKKARAASTPARVAGVSAR